MKKRHQHDDLLHNNNKKNTNIIEESNAYFKIKNEKKNAMNNFIKNLYDICLKPRLKTNGFLLLFLLPNVLRSLTPTADGLHSSAVSFCALSARDMPG